jgi:hypothetical protein
VRRPLLYLALSLGALMVIGGLASLLTPVPHPELATGGAALMIATGLVKSNGNGAAK